MPNWCYTNMMIFHHDASAVEKLYNLIDNWTKINQMENGFGTDWLGNIVLGAGIGTVDANEQTDLRCRGTIVAMNFHGNTLSVSTETAWSPMMKMWRLLVDKYLPGAEILYTAEECGCDLFWTNDPEYKNRYLVDSYDCNDVDSDWSCSEECLVGILQRLLKTDEKDIKTLLELFYDSEYEDKMSIHHWETVELDEIDR